MAKMNYLTKRGKVANIKTKAQNNITTKYDSAKRQQIESEMVYKANFTIDNTSFRIENDEPFPISNEDELIVLSDDETSGTHEVIVFRNFTNGTNNYDDVLLQCLDKIIGATILIIITLGIMYFIASYYTIFMIILALEATWLVFSVKNRTFWKIEIEKIKNMTYEEIK